MSTSSREAGERFGFNMNVFVSAVDDPDRAINQIRDQINISTSTDQLTIIAGGPMHVVCEGIRRSVPARRPFVNVISHSTWNNDYSLNGSCTAEGVKQTGVRFTQIQDQNRELTDNLTFSDYGFLANHVDANLRWVYSRMQIAFSSYPDPSDAGMAYYYLTGDQGATPEKLKAYLGG